MTFTLWVDADSCPIGVRELIIRFSKRLNIKTIFVANRPIPIEKSDLFIMVVSDSTADAADNYIVEHIGEYDMAITRDVPLASRLVEKNIVVLSDRGKVYTSENIRESLSFRNFNLELIQNGIPEMKTQSYSKKDLNIFANMLDRELQKRLRMIQNS